MAAAVLALQEGQQHPLLGSPFLCRRPLCILLLTLITMPQSCQEIPHLRFASCEHMWRKDAQCCCTRLLLHLQQNADAFLQPCAIARAHFLCMCTCRVCSLQPQVSLTPSLGSFGAGCSNLPRFHFTADAGIASGLQPRAVSIHPLVSTPAKRERNPMKLLCRAHLPHPCKHPTGL